MGDIRVDGRITLKCHKHAASYDRSTASSKASLPVLLSTFITLPSSKGTAAAVVKVLCYKSEGRWFDSRWCH